MTTTPQDKPLAAPSRDDIMALVAEVLCVEKEELDPNITFADLGVDSVLSVEVTARLREEFGVPLRAADLYEHETPAALAARLTV
jgi:acyl carrier protein